MHLSVTGQAVLAAKPHMFSSWLKIAWSCRLFFKWGKGIEGERSQGRWQREWKQDGGREKKSVRTLRSTHFLLAKFPQSLRAFSLIPSFIKHFLLCIIKTFLKWACACMHCFCMLSCVYPLLSLFFARKYIHYMDLFLLKKPPWPCLFFLPLYVHKTQV